MARGGESHHIERTDQVHVDDPLERAPGRADLLCPPHRAADDARAVDESVQAAEVRGRQVDGRLDTGFAVTSVCAKRAFAPSSAASRSPASTFRSAMTTRPPPAINRRDAGCSPGLSFRH